MSSQGSNIYNIDALNASIGQESVPGDENPFVRYRDRCYTSPPLLPQDQPSQFSTPEVTLSRRYALREQQITLLSLGLQQETPQGQGHAQVHPRGNDNPQANTHGSRPQVQQQQSENHKQRPRTGAQQAQLVKKQARQPQKQHQQQQQQQHPQGSVFLPNTYARDLTMWQRGFSEQLQIGICAENIHDIYKDDLECAGLLMALSQPEGNPEDLRAAQSMRPHPWGKATIAMAVDLLASKGKE
ncbi:hypothetical protein K504DRAFT_451574 [Pleomassaria siparia CBS 279.74]|uniref:Uncharacterized protein n=1 Tax=Pleomassaria siparia CBS 279.74 TaxID=1314801 RepID=A0A6G1JT81_9PLEO|nr:hypothetical protein K504DRAFT_451574 [Pleomassaria siparia CBS 279.74]